MGEIIAEFFFYMLGMCMLTDVEKGSQVDRTPAKTWCRREEERWTGYKAPTPLLQRVETEAGKPSHF